MTTGFSSPELINQGTQTAPSKRIITQIPDYEYSKPSAGPLVAQYIGLDAIRKKCKHFDEWLGQLEKLQDD